MSQACVMRLQSQLLGGLRQEAQASLEHSEPVSVVL